MHMFRVFPVDHHDQICGPPVGISTDSLNAAVDIALKLARDGPVELWQGNQLISVIRLPCAASPTSQKYPLLNALLAGRRLSKAKALIEQSDRASDVISRGKSLREAADCLKRS